MLELELAVYLKMWCELKLVLDLLLKLDLELEDRVSITRLGIQVLCCHVQAARS